MSALNLFSIMICAYIIKLSLDFSFHFIRSDNLYSVSLSLRLFTITPGDLMSLIICFCRFYLLQSGVLRIFYNFHRTFHLKKHIVYASLRKIRTKIPVYCRTLIKSKNDSNFQVIDFRYTYPVIGLLLWGIFSETLQG